MLNTSGPWVKLVALGSMALVAPLCLNAQDLENRPAIQPVRTGAPPPVIDGVLDDEIWRHATVITNFRQVQPVVNAEPSEPTVVYLAYDDDYLYVAFRAYDSNPDGIVANELRRDGPLNAGDHMTILLDTFQDRRNAFGFRVNPRGAFEDARVENNQNWNNQWNGIWYTDARIDAEGWTAELAIPFKTLSFDPERDVWGLDIVRRIRRKNERMRWANISQNRNDIYAGAYGDMSGLEGMKQGIGLELRPTFTLRTSEDRAGMVKTQAVISGGDINYMVTPSLIAQLSINTDFSDAPVDQVQNNLTRFSLLFPETRDFFLNDADIFQFGGLNQENGMPFFSRRMGVLSNGQPLDMLVGGKMTGRVGDLNLGLISTLIEGVGDLKDQNLSVLRGSTGVGSESRVGFIATEGDPNSNDSAALYGADFQYRNSFIGGDNVIVADAWVQKSDNPGVSDKNMAYGVKVDYPNDIVQWTAQFRELQDNFMPRLGFVNRPGTRLYETRGRLRKRGDGQALLRTSDWGFRWSRVEDMSGQLQSEDRNMKIVEIQNQDGDTLELNYFGSREVLTDPFRISPGVILAPGDYKFSRQRVRLSANDGRPLSGEIRYRWGDFYTGKIRETEVDVEWRASAHFFAGLGYQQVDAMLPEGNFDFVVSRANLDINLTPRLMIQNLIQHNTANDSLGWNSRLRWEIDPGNILTFAVTQGWEVDDRGLIPLNTNMATKLRWTFRY